MGNSGLNFWLCFYLLFWLTQNNFRLNFGALLKFLQFRTLLFTFLKINLQKTSLQGNGCATPIKLYNINT